MDDEVKVNPINRRIGLIQKYQEFCKRHVLSYRLPNNDEDPTNSFIESLETIVLRNEFKRHINEDKHETIYLRMKVYTNKRKVLTGYFTTEEIADINKTAPELSMV